MRTPYYESFLPLDLKAESQRFHELVTAVCTKVQLASDEAVDDPDAWGIHVLPFIPIVNTYFALKPSHMDLSDYQILCKSLLKATIESMHDLEASSRIASCLTEALKSRKRDLFKKTNLSLDWQPISSLLKSMLEPSEPNIEHMMLPNKINAMCNLAAEARRFFRGTGVLKEIWEALSPLPLAPANDPSTLSDRIQALVKLWLLLPTQSLKTLPASGPDLDYAQKILDQSIEAWWLGKSSGCRTSDNLWIKIISQLIRHDRRRRLQVSSSSLPQKAFVFLFDSLNLPVGTSSGPSPITPPSICPSVQSCANIVLQVGHGSGKESGNETLVSMLVHLAKRGGLEGEEGSHTHVTSRQVLDLFDRFQHLVDQYLHPSNGGGWSKDFASIIRNLVKSLVKQVSHQNNEDDADGHYRDGEEAKLGQDAVSRLVAVTVAMASRSMFSKSSTLSMASCKALGTCAYFSPAMVLPLVVQRFNLAMESSSSPHQLALSLHALAYSVRPMLHSGWQGEEEGGGLQLLSVCMTSLIPGLDANDLPKTKAALHFFITVLSSVPHLGEPREDSTSNEGICLPLFVEEWSEEVMGRLISLIENQEPARGNADLATRATSSDGSFDDLAEMTGQFINYLLSKLGKEQQRHLIRILSRWILGASLSLQSEVALLASEAAAECPDLVLELLVAPLAKQVKDSLPTVGESEANESQGLPPLSHSAETKVVFSMGILADLLIQFPGDALIASGVFNEAMEAVDRALLIPIKVVQLEGSKLLSGLGHVCSRPFCAFASVSSSPVGKDGVMVWGGKCPDESSPLQAPKWRPASDEEVNQARAMIDKYVNAPLTRLACLDGSENKSVVLALTLSLCGILSGLNTRLEEFDFKPSSGSKIAVLPGQTSASFGPGLRDRASSVLASTIPSLLSHHPSILQSLVSCIELLLCNGSQTYQSYRSVASAVDRLSDLYSEPGGLEMVQESLGPGWKARGTRWPVMSVNLRMQEAQALRVSQSSFRSFALTGRPLLGVHDLPQPFLSLFSSLSLLSRSVHASVRNQAKGVLLSISIRLPSLARQHLGTALAHLAGVEPPPPPQSAWTPIRLQEEEESLFNRITVAATRIVEKPSEELSPAQESEREARVKGSCSFVLNCLHSWRHVFRSGALLKATALGLISGRVHDSQSLQPELSNLILHTLSRFVHPPFLVALRSREMKKGGRWEEEMKEVQELRKALLKLSDPTGPLQNATHRFLFLSNMLLVLLAPFSFAIGEERGSTVPFLNHLLSLLAPNNSLEIRRLAVSGITFMISGVVDPHQGSPKSIACPRSAAIMAFDGGKEALEQFFASSSNVALLWHHLVHDHQALEQSEENKSKRGGREQWSSHSQEEKVWRYLDYALTASFGHWPSESHHSALSEGLFVVSHARLVSLLTAITPSLSSSLSSFLARNITPEKLQSVMTPSEKCEQALVSEVFGGLAAAGSLKDAASLLSLAMEHGTLEMSESWSISVRYAVSFLISRTYANQDSMVEDEQQPSSDALLLDQILSQSLKSPEEFDNLSTQGRTKALRVMIQIIQEIRKEWGGASLLHSSASAFVRGTIVLAMHLLNSSYSLVLRDLVGPLVAELMGLSPTTQEASELVSLLVTRFNQAVETVSLLRPQGQSISHGDKMQVEDKGQAEPLSQRDLSLDLAALGTGICVVSKGLRTPVEPHGLFLSCIVSLLPSLLAAQELAGPDLQKLVTDSALALSLLKYLTMLDDGTRDKIAAALIQGMKGDHWSERTASLLFLQKFWSSHGFALSPAQHCIIEESVRSLLADPREEVRRAASSTIAGLLKVLDEEKKKSFLNNIVSNSLFTKGSKRKGGSSAAASEASSSSSSLTLLQLSLVEGLRALVASAPYDCPQWLPLALTCLTCAATKATVAMDVKREAVKAVMEWRRTHEQDSIEELKRLVDSDDYLEFMSIGGSSSYFV